VQPQFTAIWEWLRDDKNTKAVSAMFISASAVASAATYVHSTLFPPPDDLIVMSATAFVYTEGVSANTFRDPETGKQGCPHQLVYNQPPHEEVAVNSASYRATLARGGNYKILVEYAASAPRPTDITVNGKLEFSGALTKLSKSWCSTRWETVGTTSLNRGLNDLQLSTPGPFPYLRTIRLVREK